MLGRHSADVSSAEVQAIVTALSARLDALVASWELAIVAQQTAGVAVTDAARQKAEVVLEALERELSDLERHCAEHRRTADDEAREATEWERRAMAAIRDGHDDVARQALIRQAEYVTAATAADVEAAALEGMRDAYRNAVVAIRATANPASARLR